MDEDCRVPRGARVPSRTLILLPAYRLPSKSVDVYAHEFTALQYPVYMFAWLADLNVAQILHVE